MAEVLKHHKARKRFGQNFLNDDYWIQKIADAVVRSKDRKLLKSDRVRPLSPDSLSRVPLTFSALKLTANLAAWRVRSFLQPR